MANYPRTFGDLQTDVINRLRLDSTGDAQKVKDMLNVAYADAAITTEFAQAKATVSPAVGGTYTFTSTPIRVRYMQITQGGQVWPVLRPRSLEQILELRAQSVNSPVGGPPQYYAFDGSATIEVYPNFLGTETMDIWAVNLPTALSASSDVPVFPEPYASVIVYGALVELSDFSKDMLTGTQGYAQMYQYWLGKLRTHVNRRQGAVGRQFQVKDSNTFTPHDPSTDIR